MAWSWICGDTRLINISCPVLLGHERQYVLDAIDSVELSGNGSYVRKFEDSFAGYTRTKYAVSCCSGTAALHLAMLAMEVKPGDRVIIPAITYIATANAIRYCGGIPVVCDVTPDTWCLDPEDVERKVRECRGKGRRVVGILPVHLYGVMADMGKLKFVAAANKLWIVEDAAEAHGATYQGYSAGSIGSIGVYSFFGNKTLTAGEGGIAITNDKVLAERMRLYKGQGMTERYWHEVVGYNYRMGNLQAAVALGQLEQVDTHLALRLDVVKRYRELLGTHPLLQIQAFPNGSSPWMLSMLVSSGIDRVRVMDQMLKEGVETRPLFYPVTKMPPYKAVTPVRAESISARGLSLPTHAAMTMKDVAKVADVLKKALTSKEVAA